MMKNKNVWKNWLIPVFIVLLILVIIFSTFLKSGSGEKIVKIGFIGPVSMEAYADPFIDSIQLAIDELNNDYAGKVRFELLVEDGKCNGEDAVTSFMKLANIDKVKYMFGGVCSGEAKGINPLLEQQNIVSISFSLLSVIGKESRNQFLVLPPIDVDVEAMLNYVKNEGKTNIAVIYANTDAGVETEKVLESLSSKYGVTLVAKETYNFGDNDFKTQLLKIKEQNPDAVFLFPQGFNAPLIIIKQLRELGFNGTVLTEDTGCAALNFASEKPSNVVCATVLGGFNTTKESYVAFKQKFEQKYGKEPLYSLYQAAAYDAMKFLGEAVLKEDDPESVRDYFINNNYVGVSGEVDFNEEGINIGITPDDVLIVKY